jgi:hypothetical protein
MITCDFCKKEFNAKYLLTRHQKTTKYCLILQDKINRKNVEIKNDEKKEKENENDNENKKKFNCEYCFKEISSKQNWKKHIDICQMKDMVSKNTYNELKNLYDNLKINYTKIEDENESLKDIRTDNIKINIFLKNLKEEYNKLKFENQKLEYIIDTEKDRNKEKDIQIIELKEQLEKITMKAIDKPTSINTNKINTTYNQLNNYISQENIDKKIAYKFTDKYITNGMKGIAQFVYDHIITLEDGNIIYACYDVSRKMFKYKDSNGNEVKDPKATKLIKMLKPGLTKQTDILYNYFSEEYDFLNELKDSKELDKEDETHMCKIKFLKDKALEIGIEINTMEENHKFGNELANLTV